MNDQHTLTAELERRIGTTADLDDQAAVEELAAYQDATELLALWRTEITNRLKSIPGEIPKAIDGRHVAFTQSILRRGDNKRAAPIVARAAVALTSQPADPETGELIDPARIEIDIAAEAIIHAWGLDAPAAKPPNVGPCKELGLADQRDNWVVSERGRLTVRLTDGQTPKSARRAPRP